MAQAATAGARTETAIRVSLLRAQDAHAIHVEQAAGYIFATPENLAAMSGQMKDFFDRTYYYSVLDRVNGRPYAALICAGSDGRNAAQQIERIATGWRLKKNRRSDHVSTHAETPERILAVPRSSPPPSLKQCEALGAHPASGIAMGIF